MTVTRIRAIGRWAAFVAAYALVFNVMLTSALLAKVSPLKFNALHELCLNGSSAPSDADGGNDDGKPIIRCPLCVSGVTAIDVPPQSAALAIRIALQVLFEPAPLDDGIARFATRDHQPRGPPHLS
jgi:hypothetical protein